MIPFVGATRSRLRPTCFFCPAMAVVIAACATSEAATDRWNGTIDTLPSGQIVVENTADPIWTDETAWHVVEELRIGRLDGDGPDLFGSIADIEVDASGRIYVLEDQAMELRIFDANGAHITTSGRDGGGPGEFARPVLMEWGYDGTLRIVDPENNRISFFDVDGTFLTSTPQPGGFIILPWPGRFDVQGNYYGPVPLQDEEFRTAMVRYDTVFVVHDTLEPPRDPVQREYFDLRSGDGFMRAGIPFTASFTWRLSRRGTFWGMLTGDYRLFELSGNGDTLRTVTRAFDALPVTAADRDTARARLEWFTRQGGKIDISKVPSTKPATRYFFWDDEDNLWVVPVTEYADRDRVAHVFDATGRFLGEVRFPFPLRSRPYPVIRDNVIHAVTVDELEVPFVVRARIEKGPGDRVAT